MQADQEILSLPWNGSSPLLEMSIERRKLTKLFEELVKKIFSAL